MSRLDCTSLSSLKEGTTGHSLPPPEAVAMAESSAAGDPPGGEEKEGCSEAVATGVVGVKSPLLPPGALIEVK